MRSKNVIFTLVLLLSFVIFNFTFLSVSQAVSSTVVISEFRTRGPNGGNDEFIELYNLSSSPINISGWEVKGSNNSGTVSTRAVINSGVILNPGCHYLLTNSNPTGGPYSGSVTGNQTYSVGITDDGGIALTSPGGTIVDQVGMSGGSVYKEGSTLSPLSGESNRSYERRPGGLSGNATDTDSNNADFRLISPSNPQSALSTCIGADISTNPSGFGAANPSSLLAGSNTLLTVNVTPGANPSSTGITVTGNLADIGGSSSQQFFDNGTNGDAVVGDNIFSFQATVASGISAGQKNLSIIITDAQARTSNVLITLSVQSLPQPGQCGVERWSVKTGTDPDANKVDLIATTPTTIATMRSWPKPISIPDDKRIEPYETTVWVVNATLTQFKRDEDSDYRLILRDDEGRTTIAKIPCSCCVAASSPFAALINQARIRFDEQFTATGSFQIVNMPIRVTGVGMFDVPDVQTDAAPNGIELHPVLDIKFNVDLHAPVIIGAVVDGKKLLIFGLNFDDGAKIYLNDVKQKTKNDDESGTTLLVAKKAGKQIAKGATVVLRVKNSDGTLSDDFTITRPD